MLHRLKHWLGVFSLFVFVAAGVWLWQGYLSQPGQLPLRVVKIEGDFGYINRTALQQQIGQAIKGQGFFTLDMPGLRQQILALPWVYQASVQRRWPDTLRIHIIEQIPVARWGDDALVNIQGDIFRPQTMPLSDAPVLSAADMAAPRVVNFYAQLKAQFAGFDLQVMQLALNAREEWVVHFTHGLTLLLGRHDVHQRVQNFLSVYQQLLANKPQRVDMRYQHGFAVLWQTTKSNS